LRTLDRPMRQDLGDKMDAAADRALREGRPAEEGVHEVLVEAHVLASKGVQQRTGATGKKVQKEVKVALPPEQRPRLFPHYRKAHDWDQPPRAGDEASPRSAPGHFFSKKTWDAVHGISREIVDMAQVLELPRPSRIQNLTFNDVAEGRSTVIADQAGSGKTLAYLLPLLKRHVFGSTEEGAEASRLKLLVLAPTSDLAEQIVDVARVISARASRPFRVHCCTGGHRAYTQKKQLSAGTDLLVATPGRLKWLLFEDPDSVLDLQSCGAVVFDEVDVLVKDDADLTVEQLGQKLAPEVQWVFVTATLAEVARQRTG